MDIEFDAAKDRANQSKHGLSLAQAFEMNWDSMLVRPDSRRDYGEGREIGYGLFGLRLCCVVFVRVADDRLRIVSFRKANAREIKAYEEATNHPAYRA